MTFGGLVCKYTKSCMWECFTIWFEAVALLQVSMLAYLRDGHVVKEVNLLILNINLLQVGSIDMWWECELASFNIISCASWQWSFSPQVQCSQQRGSLSSLYKEAEAKGLWTLNQSIKQFNLIQSMHPF